MRKYNTYIITWHYWDNFGSILQSYAINHIISNSAILDFSPFYVKKNFLYFIKAFAKLLLSKTLYFFTKKRKYSFFIFKFLNFTLSKPLIDEKELKEYCKNCKCIVCGSDQIWAPNMFNPVYFANFADGNKIKKISYAASIGLNDIPDNLVEKYKRLLSDFYCISVRERMGATLLKTKCDIENVEVVLDPTLLLSIDKYIKLEKRVNIKRPFIFCYFLNKNHSYEERVKKYAFEHNLKIVGWSANSKDAEWLGEYKWIGPSEFLWLIHNSEAVMTDSYHGTIFSLLYHKNFYTFERFSCEDPINQNSRIYQLDKWFNIKNKILGEKSELVFTEFNYIEFEKKLLKAKKHSLNFLDRALN